MTLFAYFLVFVSFWVVDWVVLHEIRGSKDDDYTYDPSFLTDVHGARTARNRRERLQ